MRPGSLVETATLCETSHRLIETIAGHVLPNMRNQTFKSLFVIMVSLHRLEGMLLERSGIAALIGNKAFRPRFAVYSGAWSIAGGIKPDSANSGGQIRVNLPMMI